jgi:serine/threonine protein kinase
MQHFNLNNINHLKDAEKHTDIGDGGFGIIELYKCKQMHNNILCNRFFVTKRAKPKPVSIYNSLMKRTSKSSNDKLYYEYDIGISLKHKNIISTFDMDFVNNIIIFEYCPGLDLLEYANKYTSPNTRGLTRLFGQLLDGVGYLHENNIAHLDLKLENVMYNPATDDIKIIDFGEAVVYKDTDGNDDTELEFYGQRGTVQYMPPEMVSNYSFRAPDVDLWCCGVFLYNLYYNKALWEKACISDLRYRIFYHSRIKDILVDTLFPKLDCYTDQETQIINSLFKILLNPDPDERKTINVVKYIFNLISFKTDENEIQHTQNTSRDIENASVG